MRAVLAGVIAAIEALAVALAGLLAVTGIAVLIWWVSFDLAAEPSEVFSVAGAVWLLAHAVPLTVTLSPEAMQAFGFAPEALDFQVTLAPLALTLVTAVFAGRSGWRFGSRGGSGVAGVVGGMLGFGAAAAAVGSFVSAAALPIAGTAATAAALYGAIAALGFVLRASREEHDWWLRSVAACEAMLTRLGVPKAGTVTARAREVCRVGAMLVLGYVGLAGVAAGIAMLLGYAEVTATSQALQLGASGAIMMFIVQLALLPVFVLWSGAWLTGAGFAVGAGTSASPFGALLGPLPGLPLLAAIPDGWGAFAILAPLSLVILGIGVGASLGATARRGGVGALIGTTAAAALLAGLAIALGSWIAAGSIGPGRLADVGPEPWLTGGLATAELGVGAALGALAARGDLLGRAAALVAVSKPAEDYDAGRVPQPVPDLGNADDQLTMPIGGDIPVIPFAGDASTEPSAPAFAEAPHEADFADTDVIHAEIADDHAEDRAEVGVLPEREPQLFDRQLVDDDAQVEPPAEPGVIEHGDPAAPGGEQHELDVDAIVQAYSWDHAAEEPAPEQPSGWRWPRKKS